MGWILRGLLAKGSLSRWLAQARSRLQARLADADIVFRRVPDELEESVVFGFVVDHDGTFVDLASDADNVATDDGRWVGIRTWLRICCGVSLAGPAIRSRSGGDSCRFGCLLADSRSGLAGRSCPVASAVRRSRQWDSLEHLGQRLAGAADSAAASGSQ